MREALEAQLHAGNIEVNVVGDFKAEELDELLVKYLGTIQAVPNPPQREEEAIDVSFPAKEIRQQTWHLKDSDERAAAYIAGQQWFAEHQHPPFSISGKSHFINDAFFPHC